MVRRHGTCSAAVRFKQPRRRIVAPKPMLKSIRSGLLQVLDFAGLNAPVLSSSWRARRLVIVCWQGISNDDEHRWDPALFMPAKALRLRLELLRAMKCNVLPLSEGLGRVRDGALPPRAVCLTVDDGDSSFYLRTWPMLREYGYPATLYWTSCRSTPSHAVFEPMLSYLLWKGRRSTLVLSQPALRCDLRDPQQRQRASAVIRELAATAAWGADRKEAFLVELAGNLWIDYARIKSKRVLHPITPEEARTMEVEGLDLQLHTPATTCQSGLVHRRSDPYALPRMMDHGATSAAEFRAGLSGVAALLRCGNDLIQHGLR